MTYPKAYVDNVNAFSSSEECKSAVMPGYPFAIMPLVDALTIVKQQARFAIQ
jgi:hypothetical protein